MDNMSHATGDQPAHLPHMVLEGRYILRLAQALRWTTWGLWGACAVTLVMGWLLLPQWYVFGVGVTSGCIGGVLALEYALTTVRRTMVTSEPLRWLHGDVRPTDTHRMRITWVDATQMDAPEKEP